MCKPPCQNLFHTCIIVRTLHRFNAKLTVIAALWLSFLINNHGTYGFKSTDIRDIKSFHSIKTFKAKPIFHFMNRSDRSAFFPSNTLTVLLQNHSRVLPCKFNKLFLGSFFGHNNTNFLFSSGCQPFLNNIRIFYLCLQCNLSRNKWCTGIKLLYKTRQYLWPGISSGHSQIKMIPSNQLAITHKKHLNNCILFSQIKAFIHITRYDISVFFSICCNLLPLADLLDTSYQISSFCSILKAHFFRCFLHFFSELIDRFLKISV